MLWTDQDFVTSADLASVDSDVVATADAQLIDLPTSIRRGIEDAGRYLEASMISFSTCVSSQDFSASHQNAVFYTGSQPNNRRRFCLEQIVVSGRNDNYWSEIKAWVVNRCLMAVYLSASNKAEGDRYEEKYETFRQKDSLEMWPLFKKSGLPVVAKPMPRPLAVQGTNTGSWSVSRVPLTVVTGSNNADFAVSFVDETLYLNAANPKNGQSALSERVSKTLNSPGDTVRVDVTDLTFPSGSLEPDKMARGFVIPLNATGWNVWFGPKSGVLRLQNPSPIPVTTKTYEFDTDLTATSGTVAGSGQYAEAFYTIPSLFFRG